jgi:predicted DNA-binding transcriptional regulator AlpA
MEWMVTASSQRLANESQWDELQDALLDVLEDLGAMGVTGWGRIGELGALFSVETPSLLQAATSGAELFQGAIEKIGAPPAARIEIEPADVGVDSTAEPVLERRLTSSGPSIPVVSGGEVAELLGISRQRVYQLLEEHDDFPRPVSDTPRGAVWDRREVEYWARKPRRPGRPRKEEKAE